MAGRGRPLPLLGLALLLLLAGAGASSSGSPWSPWPGPASAEASPSGLRGVGVGGAAGGAGGCQAISIAMCQGIGYNLTRMPNLLGHAGQGEAALALEAFAPLVSYGCDGRLRFVLCSLFAPMCAEQLPRPIPACRPMCEAARRRCAPVLAHFHFGWPAALDCARLPTRNDPHALCMEEPSRPDGDPATRDQEDEDEEDDHRRHQQEESPGGPPRPPRGQGMLPVAPRPPPPHAAPHEPHAAPPCGPGGKLRRVWRGAPCAARCSPRVDVLWSRGDKEFARAWMCAWAALCFASTAFAVLTFLLEPGRFRYPERPIVFLALCYNGYSLAFLVRGAAGAERIACARGPEGAPYLIPPGALGLGGPAGGPGPLESAPCALAFLLLYYFGMASALWWVVLSLAWFLAAGRKWGHEAIEAHSGAFHLAAWGLPALQSGAALGLRAVAGDELTGLCYVAAAPAALTGLVLVPLAGYLLAGTAFLLAGFAALFHIRRVMKTGGRDTHKLERLMVRLGGFSLLHTLPAAALIGCVAYERLHLDAWRQRALERPCARPTGPTGTHAGPTPASPAGAPEPDCTLAASVPTAAVFMLKIFLSLALGISSGAWVWSPKTLQTWQGLCRRRGRPRRRGGGGTTRPKDHPPAHADPCSCCCCCCGPESPGAGGGAPHARPPRRAPHALLLHAAKAQPDPDSPTRV